MNDFAMGFRVAPGCCVATGVPIVPPSCPGRPLSVCWPSAYYAVIGPDLQTVKPQMNADERR